jgi:hypothetical protein
MATATRLTTTRKKRASASSKSPSSAAKAKKKPSVHGGDLREGRRKTLRPLDKNKLTHVVLGSSEARGRLAFSTPANRAALKEILSERGDQFDVHVESFESHGGNLHIFLTFKSREKFQGFLRTITALIARRITGARKGKPFGRKFWDHLAFTRTVESGDGAIETYESAVKFSKKSGRSIQSILS